MVDLTTQTISLLNPKDPSEPTVTIPQEEQTKTPEMPDILVDPSVQQDPRFSSTMAESVPAFEDTPEQILKKASEPQPQISTQQTAQETPEDSVTKDMATESVPEVSVPDTPRSASQNGFRFKTPVSQFGEDFMNMNASSLFHKYFSLGPNHPLNPTIMDIITSADGFLTTHRGVVETDPAGNTIKYLKQEDGVVTTDEDGVQNISIRAVMNKLGVTKQVRLPDGTIKNFKDLDPSLKIKYYLKNGGFAFAFNTDGNDQNAVPQRIGNEPVEYFRIFTGTNNEIRRGMLGEIDENGQPVLMNEYAKKLLDENYAITPQTLEIDPDYARLSRMLSNLGYNINDQIAFMSSVKTGEYTNIITERNILDIPGFFVNAAIGITNMTMKGAQLAAEQGVVMSPLGTFEGLPFDPTKPLGLTPEARKDMVQNAFFSRDGRGLLALSAQTFVDQVVKQNISVAGFDIAEMTPDGFIQLKYLPTLAEEYARTVPGLTIEQAEELLSYSPSFMHDVETMAPEAAMFALGAQGIMKGLYSTITRQGFDRNLIAVTGAATIEEARRIATPEQMTQVISKSLGNPQAPMRSGAMKILSILNPARHYRTGRQLLVKNALTKAELNSDEGRKQMLRASQARAEQLRTEIKQSLEDWRSSTNVAQGTRAASQYIQKNLKLIIEEGFGPYETSALRFYGEEVAATFGVAAGAYAAEYFDDEVKGNGYYEFAGGIGGVLFGPTLLKVTTKVGADFGIALTDAVSWLTDQQNSATLGRLATGQTWREASRTMRSAESSAAQSIYSSYINGLPVEMKEEFQRNAQQKRAMMDNILALQARLGIQVISEDDVPLVMGDILMSPLMIQMDEMLRQSISVSEIKDIPNILKLQEQLLVNRSNFANKMMPIADELLKYSDQLDEETVSFLSGLRNMAADELQNTATDKQAKIEYITEVHNRVLELMRTGGEGTDFAASDLVRLYQQLTDSLLDGKYGDPKTAADLTAKLKEQDALNAQINAFIQGQIDRMTSIATLGDEEVLGDTVVSSLVSVHEGAKAVMRGNYDKIALNSKNPDTGQEYLVNLAPTIMRLARGNQSFHALYGEVLSETDMMESSLLKRAVSLRYKDPKKREFLGIANNAAERFLSNTYTGIQDPREFSELMASVYDALPEGSRMRDDVVDGNSPIAAWMWLENFLATASADDIAAVADVPAIRNIGITSVDDARIFADSMTLPFNVLEADEITKFFTSASYKNRGDRGYSSILKGAREEVDTALQFSLVDDMFGSPSLAPEDARNSVGNARKESRTFYERFGYNKDDEVGSLIHDVVTSKTDAERNKAASRLLDKVTKPLSASKVKNLNPNEVQRIVDTEVAPFFARIYGELDPESGEYVLVAGSEGANTVAKIIQGYASNLYLQSNAGKWLTNQANINKLPLGANVTLEGIENITKISSGASWEKANNNYAQTIRPLLNIRLKNKVVTTLDDGTERVQYVNSNTRLLDENDLFDFASLENIQDIPAVRKMLDEASDLLETEAGKFKTSVQFDPEEKLREESFKAIQKVVNEALGSLGTEQARGQTAFSVLASNGFSLVKRMETDLVASKGQEALPAFRAAMSEVLSREALKEIAVDGTRGRSIDLVKLNALLDNQDFVRAMEDLDPQRLEGLRVIQTGLKQAYRYGEDRVDLPTVGNKPTAVSWYGMINKVWQVSRHTISPRLLILEVAFRNSMNMSYNAMVDMISNPKVAKAVMDLAIKGGEPSKEQLDLIQEHMVSGLVRQMYHADRGTNDILSGPQTTRRDISGALRAPSAIPVMNFQNFAGWEQFKKRKMTNQQNMQQGAQ
jgi:hypothetical protein